MARLPKAALLRHVENGFRRGGWNLLFLSAAGEHPARYRIYRDDVALTIKIYVWNITHGGGPRNAEEYRIQITGLPANRFEPEVGGKTLILGWWTDEGIFAGFDYRRHAGPLGGSPSMQVGRPALQAAIADRFATHSKHNGEVVVAFRPDFLGTYAANLEDLHDTGSIPDEADLLRRIANEPDNVTDGEIHQEIAQPRQWAVTQTKRALRALDFADRILAAYGNRCAMCGMQLRLLDAAHILPVSEPDSTDHTNNGIALCALHHRAYDRSVVTFDPDHRIRLNGPRLASLRAEGLAGQADAFRAALNERIEIPQLKKDRPRKDFVQRANTLRGWA
jgi:putative restriction endonuclease